MEIQKKIKKKTTRSADSPAPIFFRGGVHTPRNIFVGGGLHTQKPIKQKLFSDFPGGIKSLGAWGGDFILATGTKETMEYFKEKGYATVISFQDMVL